MVVIRCTQRLLKRSRVTPDPTPPEPDALLGEWYANVIALPFRGQSSVIYGNVATRLVVLTRGSTLRTTMQQFAERLDALLTRLGAPPEAIARQREQMSDGTITVTNDRQMIGSMNDVAHIIRSTAEQLQSIDRFDLDDMEDRLANLPHVAADIVPCDALAGILARAGFAIGGAMKAAGNPVTSGSAAPLMIVATLTIRRALLERFRDYERSAARIMASHGGAIERSIVVDDGDQETLREIHVVRFPSLRAFEEYRDDAELARLATARADAVVRTELLLGREGPGYPD